METFEQWWDRVGSHNDIDASGSTARQAWHAALKQIRNDAVNRAEALSDWEKTRRGEISFKKFLQISGCLTCLWGIQVYNSQIYAFHNMQFWFTIPDR